MFYLGELRPYYQALNYPKRSSLFCLFVSDEETQLYGLTLEAWALKTFKAVINFIVW